MERRVVLEETFESAAHERYRARGGPWDVDPLDTIFGSAMGPTGIAIADNGQSWDRAALDDAIARTAGGLIESGVRHHDVVSWQIPNGVDAFVLYRACWRIGAVAAPVHHLAGAAEKRAMLDQVDARLIVEPGAIPVGAPVTECRATPDDLAAVLFTSGSTGRPKAALHRQSAFAYKAAVMAAAHDLTAVDAVLMPAPLAHISGLLNGVLLPSVVPMKVVLMARWDPSRAVDLIARERITFMIGPPTFFVSLLSAPNFDADALRSLRLVSSGGAGVSPSFVADAARRLGARVKRTYGSTEFPTITTSVAADSDDRARDHDGRATGAAELRVVDVAAGEPIPAGAIGELELRGPEGFVGYVNAADNERAFDGDWFRTGDLATIDADGWLTVVGRIKDVIIRGGENIAASELENVLEAHPAVHSAVVVGYPDALMGERVCAFIVADAPIDLTAVRQWFVDREVATFKTPERVVQLEAMPLLAAGKIDRGALRDLAAQPVTQVG